jgi:hypothetical protein
MYFSMMTMEFKYYQALPKGYPLTMALENPFSESFQEAQDAM